MKKFILLFSFALAATAGFAQKKTTTSATVAFDATTPKDDLPKAENKTVIGSIDTQTGAVAFEAAVSNFSFSNPKIQEHFNGENWLNSAKFPKFSFSGKIDKLGKVKFDKNGSYEVDVTGTLTVKDATKPVTVHGKITVKDGAITVNASFSLVLADYGISGAPIDGGKVSKEPKVTVTADFQ